MATAVKIPFMTTDFIVLEDEVDLVAYIAVHGSGVFQATATALFNEGTLFDRERLAFGQARDTRVHADSYILRIPFDQYSATGSVQLTAYGTESTNEVSDTVTLRVFPAASILKDVTTDAELKAALITAKSNSGTHTKIRFATGSYAFPAATDSDFNDWDLSETNKLVSFEAAPAATVTIATAAPWVKWGYWKGVSFISPSGNAVSLDRASYHVFDSCRFSNATVGLSVSSAGNARLENCGFTGLRDAVVGASVVRGAFWQNITGTVFQNVSRLIEGTTGYGLSRSEEIGFPNAWAVYTAGVWDPMIRHNMAVDLHPSILVQASGASFQFAGITGNVFNSFSTVGMDLQSIESSYIAHNSVRSAESEGESIRVSGRRSKSNVFVNNYFTRLPTNMSLLSDGNTWDHNSIASVVPGFANRYLILRQDSALLNRGDPQTGMARAFGSLKYQNQIGAMPYHPDAALDSILSNVITQPDFGFSTKNSIDGDFVAIYPAFGSGGQLVFSDGTQSGWLAVVT